MKKITLITVTVLILALCNGPSLAAQALSQTAAGKPVELIVGEGFNHFEIQETIANPFGLGGRAALSMMKLKVGVA